MGTTAKTENAKGVLLSPTQSSHVGLRTHRGPWCARSSPGGPTRSPRVARRL